MSDINKTNTEFSFEDFKNENGMTFWWASHLQEILGYKSLQAFSKSIEKATKALMSLGIPVYENIVPAMNPDKGISDYKLTRFACYLVVMNGDPKKEEVAMGQAYFATMTRNFEIVIENSNEIERLVIRDDIKDGNKELTSVAKNAGLTDYAKFTNAGYRGLYNMYNWQLAKKRSLPKDKLFDHMGRTELAANLFRITMTEERIKSRNVKGQSALENTHFEVGREVRNVVQKNVGKSPEQLPVEEKLNEVRKEIKKGYRDIKKLDK